MNQENSYFIYILECSDGTYYTGWTNDLERRVEAHNSGRGAKYTRARRPVLLVYHEQFDNESDARKREAQLKGWTRAEKIALIKGGEEKAGGTKISVGSGWRDKRWRA